MAPTGRLSPPIDTRPRQSLPRSNSSTVSPKYKRKFRAKTTHHSISMPPASSYQLSSITGNGGVPRPIRKPRKIIYLIGVFILLYWFGVRHGLGTERVQTPLGYAMKGGRRRKSSLRYDKLGLAVLSPPQEGDGQHPIYELMERGEERWYALLDSQSRTLSSAVAEYKRRYILDPPAGFDRWWAFCEQHNITIRDDYDQLMKDVLPHYALEPATFIKRSKALRNADFTYTLEVSKSNGVKISGPRKGSARPGYMENLIGGFARYLPDGFEVKAVVSDHDTGSDVLGRDQRDRAMELVRSGERELPSPYLQIQPIRVHPP